MDRQLTSCECVNRIVERLLGIARRILGDNFVGAYLHGSLAVGDFNPQTSDVDFLLVVREPLDDTTIHALREMHQRLIEFDPNWGARLEGSFLPIAFLQSADPPTAPRPYTNGRHFGIDPYGYEWVLEMSIVRENTIRLAGPPPDTLIPPISHDAQRRAIAHLLHRNWKPMLHESVRLQDAEYQAYAVLTMCRCLYFGHHHKIGSKKTAAQWVQTNYPEWSDLSQTALVWTKGDRFDRLAELENLIQFTCKIFT